MLNNQIKSLIENHTSSIMETNPIFISAQKGEIRPEQVVKYLHNILYFAQHTPIHLKVAHQKSLESGQKDVAEFMSEKIEEENGHDQWAINDLKSLSSPASQVDLSQITPSLNEFLSYAKELIHNDPSLYLPYMLSCEYFTVLAAPKFLGLLEEKCNISPSSMTIVSNHEELDQDHVEDDLAVISKVTRDEAHSEEMIRVAEKSMDLISSFLSECVH